MINTSCQIKKILKIPTLNYFKEGCADLKLNRQTTDTLRTKAFLKWGFEEFQELSLVSWICFNLLIMLLKFVLIPKPGYFHKIFFSDVMVEHCHKNNNEVWFYFESTMIVLKLKSTNLLKTKVVCDYCCSMGSSFWMIIIDKSRWLLLNRTHLLHVRFSHKHNTTISCCREKIDQHCQEWNKNHQNVCNKIEGADIYVSVSTVLCVLHFCGLRGCKIDL